MTVERRPDGTTRGGNEPPDEVQDTPEQNAGYDEAARHGRLPDAKGQPDPHETDRGKTALMDRPPRAAGRGTDR